MIKQVLKKVQYYWFFIGHTTTTQQHNDHCLTELTWYFDASIAHSAGKFNDR